MSECPWWVWYCCWTSTLRLSLSHSATVCCQHNWEVIAVVQIWHIKQLTVLTVSESCWNCMFKMNHKLNTRNIPVIWDSLVLVTSLFWVQEARLQSVLSVSSVTHWEFDWIGRRLLVWCCLGFFFFCFPQSSSNWMFERWGTLLLKGVRIILNYAMHTIIRRF